METKPQVSTENVAEALSAEIVNTATTARAQSPAKKKATNPSDQRKENLIALGADKLSGWDEVEEAHTRATSVIALLDSSVNRALRAQEFQYLQAYNIYVKNKESELKSLITDFKSNKEAKNKDRDQRISNLEITIQQMANQASDDAREIHFLKVDNKKWKQRVSLETEEKDFFHKQAKDAKRKNKLLKVAMGRIGFEVKPENLPELPKINSQTIDKDESTTFLTGARIDENKRYGSIDESQLESIENIDALVEENIAKQARYQSKLSFKKPYRERNHHARHMSQSVCLTETKSHYHKIQTENLKFKEFVDMIFYSFMPKVEIKQEIISYVQALETNYNQTIKEEKIKVEKLRKDIRKEKRKNLNETLEKSDLENLFVEQVEDVR